MFKLKSRHPIVGLLLALVILFGMWMMMEGVLQQASMVDEDPLPELGKSYLSEASLAVFRDKWSELGDEALDESWAEIHAQLEGKKRSDFYGYLGVHLEYKHLELAPSRYIGQMLPVYFENGGQFATEAGGEYLWREMSWKGKRVQLMLMSPYLGKDSSPTYAELFFLGPKKVRGLAGGNVDAQNLGIENPKEEEVWLAVALELHELPEKMEYPRLDSDALAFDLIVDDMSSRKMQKMTREVSGQAFSHFMAKVQSDKLLAEAPKIKEVRYTQLMEAPDAYRGQKVSFTGSLIFKKRNRLTSQGLPPGLDVYEEGYLLNSNRILYVFRTDKIPQDIQLKDVVTVEGYFLQRFNFLNRMDKATWAPLLVASKVAKAEEKEFGMTAVEKRVIMSFLLVVGVLFLWLVLRKPKIQKRLRVKKDLKPKSKS